MSQGKSPGPTDPLAGMTGNTSRLRSCTSLNTAGRTPEALGQHTARNNMTAACNPPATDRPIRSG